MNGVTETSHQAETKIDAEKCITVFLCKLEDDALPVVSTADLEDDLLVLFSLDN